MMIKWDVVGFYAALFAMIVGVFLLGMVTGANIEHVACEEMLRMRQ